MRRYRRHALCCALFLAGYLALGAVFRWTRPGGEVFPVSSWTLFLYVPNEVTEYGVEVLSVRGRDLDPPLAFHGSELRGAGDIRADRVVNRMGRAAERGDERALAELRELFEPRYLGAGSAPVRYRLVRRSYAPLERWRGGAVREAVPLRELAFEGPAS